MLKLDRRSLFMAAVASAAGSGGAYAAQDGARSGSSGQNMNLGTGKKSPFV